MTALVKIKRKPPAALRPVKFRHFYQFVNDLDDLSGHYEWLRECYRDMNREIPAIGAVEEAHNNFKSEIEDCREGMRRYNRDGDGDARYDDDGELTFEYASQRLGMMLKGWTNATFPSEEAAKEWAQMLVEHVLARNPTACELESACRKLIDNGKPFRPEIPEILAVLKAEQSIWFERKRAIRDVESVYKLVIEAIPKAKAAAEKHKADEEAKAARYRAATEASFARRRLEAEVEAACKEAEAEEALWKAEEKYEASRRSTGHAYYAQYVWLKEALKDVKSGFKRDEHVISCAIGLYEERRKLRAWEREAELEALRQRDHEALSQHAYSTGENDALNPPSTLEGLLKLNAANYSRAESYLVSYALGVFEMRRELRAWRQAWARSKYGLPIWA
jgi:hypothetical protein